MALPKKRTESCAAASGATLLDQLMPVFEFGHCHTIIVEAAVRMVAAGIEAYRLDQSFLVRLLFRLRGLGPAPGTLRGSLINRGFTLLAEESGREVVVGIAGRFWALNERANLVATPDAAAFVAFDRPGFAKAAMSIRFDALVDGGTRLGTETRVRCTDAGARRRFALYWAVVGPFSAWIRQDLLRAIAARAV